MEKMEHVLMSVTDISIIIFEYIGSGGYFMGRNQGNNPLCQEEGRCENGACPGTGGGSGV